MEKDNESALMGHHTSAICALLLFIDLTDLCYCLLAVGDGLDENNEAMDVIKTVYWVLIFGEQASLSLQFILVLYFLLECTHMDTRKDFKSQPCISVWSLFCTAD